MPTTMRYTSVGFGLGKVTKDETLVFHQDGYGSVCGFGAPCDRVQQQ
jgi:hypothetical protein